MRGSRLSIGLRVALTIFTNAVFLASTCVATERVLHNFNYNGKDGYATYSSLVLDGAGNLYGTTKLGGTHPGAAPAVAAGQCLSCRRSRMAAGRKR